MWNGCNLGILNLMLSSAAIERKAYLYLKLNVYDLCMWVTIGFSMLNTAIAKQNKPMLLQRLIILLFGSPQILIMSLNILTSLFTNRLS